MSRFAGELVEELPQLDAGSCKYRCYAALIKTKKGAEYYRVFCGKIDKKCRPYKTIPTAITLSRTLKAELTETISYINLVVWDDYEAIPSPVTKEIRTLVKMFNGRPGGTIDENYQNYILSVDLSVVVNAIEELPLLKSIIKVISPTTQKAISQYREQLRQRLKPLAITKIAVWQSQGEMRVYTTIKDTIDSDRFEIKEGSSCDPEVIVEAQTVLYVTGNNRVKPGAYQYLGGKCGGSRKYPVYAYPKKELYNKKSIEGALEFQLDSAKMLELQTIYVR